MGVVPTESKQTLSDLIDLAPGEDVIKTIYHVASPSPHPYKVTLELNGKPLEMEIDTGAAVSIFSEKRPCSLQPN